MSATTTVARCGFCGKGPFPSAVGLIRHVQQSIPCHRASQKEFGSYRNNIWHADRCSVRPENIPLPNGDDDDDFGIELDNDIQHMTFEPRQPSPSEPAPVSTSRRATVEEVPDEGEPGVHYVEEFPEEHRAGAVWGQGTPKFEEIRQKLEADGTRWGPFEDEEDWELAEWLMKNVGQTQAETFLKLPIVSLGSTNNSNTSSLLFDRLKIAQSHCTRTSEIFSIKSTRFQPPGPSGFATLFVPKVT